jgi:hypothetical protein
VDPRSVFTNPRAGNVNPNTGFADPAGFVDPRLVGVVDPRTGQINPQTGAFNPQTGAFNNTGSAGFTGIDPVTGLPVFIPPTVGTPFLGTGVVGFGYGTPYTINPYPYGAPNNMGPVRAGTGMIGSDGRFYAGATLPRRRSRSQVNGDVKTAPATTEQVRLAARAETLMQDRPFREGTVEAIGADQVQVRYSINNQARSERIPEGEVFYFRPNGEMATAARSPMTLRVGDKVLIPTPQDDLASEPRQAVAGSRETASRMRVTNKVTPKRPAAAGRTSTNRNNR